MVVPGVVRYSLLNLSILLLYKSIFVIKSLLMDVFFECMPIKEKRRVHFNSFMLEFHNRRFRNKFEKKL